MKSLILTLSTMVIFIGCATMKKQQNINKIMETHVFDASADTVYAAAEAEFQKMYSPITQTKKHNGSSPWLTKPKELGSKKYQEKDRFVVKVTLRGKDKSLLVITREAKSNYLGKWSEPTSDRMFIYEFNIQKRLDPVVAAQIDATAAKMK